MVDVEIMGMFENDFWMVVYNDLLCILWENEYLDKLNEIGFKDLIGEDINVGFNKMIVKEI